MPQFSGNDVKYWFGQFGLTPSPEELTAFQGLDYIGGGSAIADYVLTKNTLAKQQAEDPLNKVMAAEKTFGEAQQLAAQGYGKRADALYSQLQEIMGQAPKLFGNFTPEMIDQYIAPLKTTFSAADASAQTGAAARGLAGSSIEANARNDQSRLFKENVLNTGLNVGMSQQQLQQKAIQDEIARQSGLLMGSNANALSAFGLQQGAAGQLSQNQQQNALLLSSLPNYLQAQNLQQLAMRNANKSPSPWGAIGTLAGTALGAGAGFLVGGPVGAGLGAGLGGSIGGGIGGIASGNPSYATAGTSLAYMPWLMGSGNRGTSSTGPASTTFAPIPQGSPTLNEPINYPMFAGSGGYRYGV